MILDGLNDLKEKVESIDPEYVDTMNVRSLLTLFVEKPLLQHESRKHSNTHYACFLPAVSQMCEGNAEMSNEDQLQLLHQPKGLLPSEA